MATHVSLCLLCCLLVWDHSTAAKPVNSRISKTSVSYHAPSGKLSIRPDDSGEGGPDFVGYGMFAPDTNKTGWSYLYVKTFQPFPDSQQAYVAGYLEGSLTQEYIKNHWINTMGGFCPKPYSKFCAKLSVFLEQNLKWMKEQIQKGKSGSGYLPYWHQVEMFLYQAAGLIDGYKNNSINPHTDIDPMSFYLFQVGGDIEDLESALGNVDFHRPIGAGSCSALVKLLPGNQELYASQDTWNDYESMLRIIKVYDMALKMTANGTELIPGGVQVFSSYPGVLMSGDDFYMLSSGMVSMETTIGNSNSSLWKYVTPETVLEGIRSVVANRLAKTGMEWAQIFSYINSGTYNNEWMIVDYKRFQPGMQTLPPGVLTVLDQIPGYIIYRDLTNLLTGQGYFPSYNVAYFPEIFNLSGGQANVKKYGDWFTYDKTPRALIFKRDHVKVKDLESMTKLMRYNDFTHDPLSRCNCTPPYSAENAISARSDLNPKDGKYPFGALGHRLHGGTDMKLTSSKLVRDLTMVTVGGPTWDQQPPFRWSTSDFNATSHLGQPDLWQFSPFTFNYTKIFL